MLSDDIETNGVGHEDLVSADGGQSDATSQHPVTETIRTELVAPNPDQIIVLTWGSPGQRLDVMSQLASQSRLSSEDYRLRMLRESQGEPVFPGEAVEGNVNPPIGTEAQSSGEEAPDIAQYTDSKGEIALPVETAMGADASTATAINPVDGPNEAAIAEPKEILPANRMVDAFVSGILERDSLPVDANIEVNTKGASSQSITEFFSTGNTAYKWSQEWAIDVHQGRIGVGRYFDYQERNASNLTDLPEYVEFTQARDGKMVLALCTNGLSERHFAILEGKPGQSIAGRQFETRRLIVIDPSQEGGIGLGHLWAGLEELSAMPLIYKTEIRDSERAKESMMQDYPPGVSLTKPSAEFAQAIRATNIGQMDEEKLSALVDKVRQVISERVMIEVPAEWGWMDKLLLTSIALSEGANVPRVMTEAHKAFVLPTPELLFTYQGDPNQVKRIGEGYRLIISD